MNSKILCFLFLLVASKLSAQTSITLLEPANGATNLPLHPVFKWTKPTYATGFVFQISEKADFSQLYTNIQQSGNSLPLLVSLFPSTKYFWRVRPLYSSGENSDWSPVFSFTTMNTIINLNTTLIQPADNSEQDFHNSIIFKWRKNDGIQYVLQLSTDKAKINNDFWVLLGWDTTYHHLPLLEFNKTYYWRVCTIAPQGPWSPIFSFKMVDSVVNMPVNMPDPAVKLSGPALSPQEKASSFPNPFSAFVTITFQLDSPGTVQFEISDSQGLKVDRFEKTFPEKGNQSVEWSSNSSKPGIYFCKIVAGEKIELVKLFLIQ